MILWMILTVMVALAAVGLTLPLVRRYDARAPRDNVVEVLKSQLADIDAQAASGTVAPPEAEGLRNEVKRRLLTESREAPQASRPLSSRALVALAFGVVAVVALAATGLYARLGRPDLPSASVSAPAAGPSDAAPGAHPGGGDVPAMIAQLEAKLKQSPNDPEGWGMLGWSYFQTGRYAEAASAYGQAATLDPKNAEHPSSQGESLVRAAGGQVTPAAQDAFRQALTIDPGDPRARYFMAVAKDQGGDHKGAMDDWIALLRTAPEGAAWATEVRTFVEGVAKQRGEDISARLPPAVATAAAAPQVDAAAPGPDASQVAAAGQMSDAERQSMIAGMVDNLAAKLRASPNDPDGWVRLMRARMVLGQTDQAAADYRDARKALSGAQQAQVREAAKGLGVPGV
jgi:cytochrome c-type biogenesis protein CcmH